MMSKYSTIKRSISTTPILNKRKSIDRKPRFIFDYNNTTIKDAIDYNKDIKNVKIENDFTEKTDSSFTKAIEKRRKLFGDDLKPKDFYTYRTSKPFYPQEIAEQEIEKEPHFKLGDKKVYLPEGAITLLPNLPNMSPYFARFKVPKSYNKLDIRDYLFHYYGLKVFDMRVSLSRRKILPQKNNRNHFLSSQEKIIVCRMEKPFVWPQVVSTETEDELNRSVMREYRWFSEDAMRRSGSDVMKPSPKHIYEGIGGHLEPLPQPFIAKSVYNKWNKEIVHSRQVKDDEKLTETLEHAFKQLSTEDKIDDTNDVKQIE